MFSRMPPTIWYLCRYPRLFVFFRNVADTPDFLFFFHDAPSRSIFDFFRIPMGFRHILADAPDFLFFSKAPHPDAARDLVLAKSRFGPLLEVFFSIFCGYPRDFGILADTPDFLSFWPTPNPDPARDLIWANSRFGPLLPDLEGQLSGESWPYPLKNARVHDFFFKKVCTCVFFQNGCRVTFCRFFRPQLRPPDFWKKPNSPELRSNFFLTIRDQRDQPPVLCSTTRCPDLFLIFFCKKKASGFASARSVPWAKMATVLKVIPAFQYSLIFCRVFPNVVPAPQHFFLSFTPRPPTFLNKKIQKKNGRLTPKGEPDGQRNFFQNIFKHFFRHKNKNTKKNSKKNWPPDSQTGARRPNKSLSKLEEQIGKHGISLSGS